MFGIGSTELLVILLVALVVLGPKSLAGVSRSLGKAIGEFRRVSTDFQRTLNAEVAREEEEEKQRKAAPAPDDKPATTVAAEAAPQPEGVRDATLDVSAAASRSDAPASPVPPAGSPLDRAVAATREAASAPDAVRTAASAAQEGNRA